MTVSQQEAPVQEKPQAKRWPIWVYVLIGFLLAAILWIVFLSWISPQIEEIFNRVNCACLMGEELGWPKVFIS